MGRERNLARMNIRGLVDCGEVDVGGQRWSRSCTIRGVSRSGVGEGVSDKLCKGECASSSEVTVQGEASRHDWSWLALSVL